MKSSVDIHVVLSTFEDMEHAVYDNAEEDIETQRLEQILHYAWESWQQDKHLLEIDDDELLDWVDHTLATWDDAVNDEIS